MGVGGIAVDAAFQSELAEAASYSDGTVSGVACRVMLRRPDADVSFGSGQAIAEATEIDVRASEVTPVQAGEFVIGGMTFRVTADPRQPDPARLVWRCEAVRV